MAKNQTKPTLALEQGSAHSSISEDLPYQPAVIADDMVADLIKKYHPHLVNSPVVCIFTTQKLRDHGKDLFMDVKRIQGLSAWFANQNTDAFFVILIRGDAWLQATEEQQTIALDTQLSRLWCDTSGRTMIRPYEFQGFVAIANRYGIQGDDMDRLVRAAAKASGMQLSLMEGEEGADSE